MNYRGGSDVSACMPKRLEVVRSLHVEGGVIMSKRNVEKHWSLQQAGHSEPFMSPRVPDPTGVCEAGSFTDC